MNKSTNAKSTFKIKSVRLRIADKLRGKSELVAKVVMSSTGVLLGISFILIFIYVIIPSILNNTTEMLEQDIALDMYEKTVNERPPITSIESDAQPAFEQPETKHAVLFPRDAFITVLDDNPDIIGRITAAPDIAYLVTQYSNNEYYLTRGYDREESKSGTIFLDYRCNAKTLNLQGHYILYGHHMKNGTMFAHLMEYKNEKFFEQNRIIRFDTLYEDYEWEIFSVYVTDTDFYYIDTVFADDEEWLTFLYNIKQKSMFDTNTQLSSDDVLLTLSTCTYEFDNARFVVHAKLIKDER